MKDIARRNIAMAMQTQAKLYSFEEYCQYDDGTDIRYELVDGRLEIMNPPTFRHLLIAKYIERALEIEISRLNLPWLCFKEAGIRTGWRKSRLSDVFVVTQEQVMALLDESAICQTPPLLVVVEVVSPESIKRDYRYKRSEYAALAISEYWIVDPIENKVTVLNWNEGLYDEAIFAAEERIVSSQFPELQLTVTQILAAGAIR
jgi:Uma2 family endonuclease